MKIAQTALPMPFAFLLALGLLIGGTMEAGALSREIAPDAPAEIVEKLLPDAKVYMTGNGTKELLLLADSFCENSRKTYRELKNHRGRIKAVRILWVSAFPERGSETAAAFAMKMQALGKGESALEAVFNLAVPPPARIEKARKGALVLLNERFRMDLAEMDLDRLEPELNRVQRNTSLAKKIGYTGTPHLIVDGRVLHGYSGPAIRILLKQGP